ncbi:hypothetical protein K438DRAFT_1908796 [Mycena galopus ATCC 62051]|nr:hypothetical protein K438DRAFT_1908796 [Mycena galopus ATCC 62051]
MSSSVGAKLFEPLKIGTAQLQHRVVLAPMTRFRADAQHVPLPLVSEYYSQRASRPGTLLITEATFIAARAGGYAHAPGIWSRAQVAAWKAITDTVHSKGSFIFSQLWALGRAADVEQLQQEDPSFPYVSASDDQLTGKSASPRPLTILEINEYVQLYAQAAKNAIEAGFDGVEIHGASGYLPHQFLHDECNKRTDDYGGSIENRARFVLEIVDAVVSVVGAEKTAIRLSPWNHFQGMAMRNPVPTFSHVISELAARHPDLAYLHLEGTIGAYESNDAFRLLWAPRPFIRAGGFTREDALETAESGDLVAFGRWFTSNPDLPTRIEKDIPFAPYDRSTFYLKGDVTSRGFTDHPFAL